jgi:dihydroflavonol-4-reductase
MNILITGATGFIGKNLVERLLKERYDLTCLVRRTSNVDFLKTQNVALVTADITNAGEVNKIFSEIEPEVVFHCAAGVMEKDEGVLYKANVEGTRNICRGCLDNNAGKLIYVSSVAVISGNEHVPLRDDLPYKASNAYGSSKIEAERIAVEFRNKGLRVSILRPCMVYGEDEPHALGRILQLVKARRIPILDVPGMDSKLNLVYIDNVVQALILAFKNDGSAQGTFIIADPEIITL